MDILIGWRKWSCDFGGGKVTMELLPLKRDAYLAIEPYLGSGGNPKREDEDIRQYLARLSDDEKRKMTRDSFKLQELIKEFGPSHIRDLQGITINGAPITMEQLSEEVQLNPLAVQIVTQLAIISTLPDAEVKKLDGPPASTPSESENTATSPDGPPGAGSTSSSPALTAEQTEEVKRAVKSVSQRNNGSVESGQDPAA